MGRYIGRDAPYGAFDKQKWDILVPTNDLILDYYPGTASSLLVNHNGVILEPEVDYVITPDKHLVLVPTINPIDQFYVVYLGKQLAISINTNSDLTDIVSEEIPIGAIDGSNVNFTITNSSVSGSLVVYLNGLRLKPGAGNDFIASSNSFIMNYAPLSGDTLVCEYIKQ